MARKVKFVNATWRQSGELRKLTAAHPHSRSDQQLEQWLQRFLPDAATDVSWHIEVAQ